MIEVLDRLSSQSLHLYKQAFATFASCLLSISVGLTFGYTAVLLPQLHDDATFPYDESFDSWIASIAPFAMIFGCLCSGPINDGLGRKTSHIMLTFPFLISWVIMGFATNNGFILLGRFVAGMCSGAVRPTSMVYIGEITDPKYRAITLFCPSLSLHIGVLISHIVGKYLYWKTCCFVFGLPNLMCFIIIILLNESPLWLISKGKIEQGTTAFKQFRGEEEAAEKELAAALQKQSEKKSESIIKDLLNVIFSRAFLKSLTTVFLLFTVVQVCGVNIISFYAQDIFKRIFSGDVDPFALMLATDCVKVFSATAVCVFAKTLPRKMTFLVCSFATAMVLIFIAVYIHIQPVGFVWLAVTLIVAYMAIGSAMISFAWSFVAEIFPGNVRGLGSGLSSFISFSLLFLSVKITPVVMVMYGETAMYTGYAVFTLVPAVLLCFILPETNGKSLQDIEDSLYKQNDSKSINTKTVSQSVPA